MKKITDNYLLFNEKREFNKPLFDYFVNRLGMLLGVSVQNRPALKLKNLNDCRACYDDKINTIVFDMRQYELKNKLYSFDNDKVSTRVSIDVDDFNYVMPLADIYHELIHYYQYQCTDYKYTTFLEASNETYTIILTGDTDIDYVREVVALWNVAYNLLHYRNVELYLFFRDCIVKNRIHGHFIDNANFIHMLSKQYNGKMKLFFEGLTTKFYDESKKEECFKSLLELHNLFFYHLSI